MTTRGNETIILTENTELKIDTKDAKAANKNWNRKFVLFDLYSNDIISPKTNGNGLQSFNIWYKETSTKKNINKTFTEVELESLKEYKFASEANLDHWFEYENTAL